MLPARNGTDRFSPPHYRAGAALAAPRQDRVGDVADRLDPVAAIRKADDPAGAGFQALVFTKSPLGTAGVPKGEFRCSDGYRGE